MRMLTVEKCDTWVMDKRLSAIKCFPGVIIDLSQENLFGLIEGLAGCITTVRLGSYAVSVDSP